MLSGLSKNENVCNGPWAELIWTSQQPKLLLTFEIKGLLSQYNVCIYSADTPVLTNHYIK